MRQELTPLSPNEALKQTLNRRRVSGNVKDVPGDTWISLVAVRYAAGQQVNAEEVEAALIASVEAHEAVDKVDVLCDVLTPNTELLDENEQFDLYADCILRVSNKPEQE